MMSIAPIQMSSAEAAQYYSSVEMQKEDYYTDKEEAPGHWSASASALGLSGEVTEEDLLATFNGQHAETEERLIGRGNSSQRSPGWDVTFSAPKSVSALWASAAASGDKQLQDQITNIIDRAAETAMDRVIKVSFKGSVRRVERDKQTGKKVERYEDPRVVPYAKFHHRTSRMQQPNLHVHVIIPNMAQRQDGSWGALKVSPYRSADGKSQGGAVFKDKMLTGAIFRAELSHLIQTELGVKCERERDFFRATQVPKDLERHWSRRREQIEQAMAKKGMEGGKAAASAALLTREKKTQIDEKALFTSWGKEVEGLGHRATFARKLLEQPIFLEDKDEAKKAVIRRTLVTVTERSSTFTERELKTRLAVESQTLLSNDEMKKAYQELIKDQEVVELGVDGRDEKRYTTKTVRDLETEVAGMAKALAKRGNFPVASEKKEGIVASAGLHPTQEAATRMILKNSDLQVIEGAPGTGKSYALGVAKKAFEAEGYKVHAIAPTGKVAGALKKDLNLEATTVDRFLFDAKRDQIAEGQILLVDEAGMIGSQKMHGILSVAMETNMKVVLVGDEYQFAPIEYGGAFGAIKSSVPEATRITEIIRQKDDWARTAVADLQEGRAFKALEAYRERDLLKISPRNEQRLNEVASDYVKKLEHKPLKEVLVLAQRNDDVDTLNALIREKLKDLGKIQDSKEVTLRTRDNEEFKSELGAGDRVMFTRNNKYLGVVNGEMGILEKVAVDSNGKERWVVVRDDGETVTLDSKRHNYLRQAYAVTNFKSQGTTVDETLVALSPSTSRVDAHVVMSRQRENASVYVAQEQWTNVKWQDFRGKLTHEEKEDVKLKALYSQMLPRVSRFEPKETSLNWEQKFEEHDAERMVEKKVYYTPEIKERIGKIATMPVGKGLVNELYSLAQTPAGVSNKWLEPSFTARTPWQDQAHKMLLRFDFSEKSRQELVDTLDTHGDKRIELGVEAVRSKKIEDFRANTLERMTKVFDRAYQRAHRFETEYATPELKALAPTLDKAKELSREQRIWLLAQVATLPRGRHVEEYRVWNKAPTVVQQRAEQYLAEGKLDTKRLKQLGKTIEGMSMGLKPDWTRTDKVTKERQKRVESLVQSLQDRFQKIEKLRSVEGPSRSM